MLRIDLAQFRELETFAQFASELDPATRAQIVRGQHLQELLKQDQYSPMLVEEQVVVLYAGINGYLDNLPLESIKDFESEFLRYMRSSKSALLKKIADEKQLTEEIEDSIKEAIEEFLKGWHE